MLSIYNLKDLRKYILPHWFNDAETIEAVRSCNEKTGYIIDPHGAIAWQSWQRISLENLKTQKGKKKRKTCIDGCAKDSLIGLVLQT